MALANVLGSDYAVVSELHFNQHTRSIGFELICYTDSSKKKEIRRIHMDINGNPVIWQNGDNGYVLTDTFPSQLTTTPSGSNDTSFLTWPKWIVNTGTTDAKLAGNEGKILMCGGVNAVNENDPTQEELDAAEAAGTPPSELYGDTVLQWHYYFTDPSSGNYKTTDGKYYEMDGTQVSEVTVYSPENWDSDFSITTLNGSGKNLNKSIYTWIKTQPGFETATDV